MQVLFDRQWECHTHRGTLTCSSPIYFISHTQSNRSETHGKSSLFWGF